MDKDPNLPLPGQENDASSESYHPISIDASNSSESYHPISENLFPDIFSQPPLLDLANIILTSKRSPVLKL